MQIPRCSPRCIPILTIVAACGATPVADVPDSSPPDVICDCPRPPELNSDTIRHVPWLVNFQPGLTAGTGAHCDEGDIAIGGSCTYYGTDPRMRIVFAGNRENPDRPHGWSCGWHSRTQEWEDVAVTAICLRTEANPSSAESCDCTDFEPIAERIDRVTRTEPYQSYSTNELTVECRDGGLLLGGGCADQWPLGDGNPWYYMTLSRSGFANPQATAWHCGWNMPADAGGEIMLATAYCLQPPTYGPDPLEGRITHAVETQTVPASSYASFTASCAPGELLLSGSCMLDSADPVSHEAIMYHHGFDADDSNTWRCAWNNPTDLSLSATATATCIIP